MTHRKRTAWAATLIVLAACIGTTEVTATGPEHVPHKELPTTPRVETVAVVSTLTSTATAKVIKTGGLIGFKI